MTSVRNRIVGGVLAAGFARILRFADQIILVPLFLSAWGGDKYGEWVALNSVAFVTTICSLGIADAASSDIVLRYAAGDLTGARRSFVTLVMLLTGALSAGFAIVYCAVRLWGLSAILPLHAISILDGNDVVLIASFAQLLFFFTIPLGGVVGAVLGPGVPTLLFGISRALEIIGIAIALQLRAPPLEVALVTFAAVLLNIMLIAIAAVRSAPWLRLRFSDFDFESVKRTWKASLGFFGLFVAMGIVTIHAPRLIIVHLLGASALTTFMVMVTYTRAARMIAQAISQPAQVEIGRAFGNLEFDRARKLIENVIKTTTALVAIVLAAELVCAPFFIPLWTRHEVAVVWLLLTALAGVAFVGTYFDSLMASVAAFNRVVVVSACYGISLIIGLTAGVLLLPSLGSTAMALGLICPEFVGSLAAIRTIAGVLPHTRTLPIVGLPTCGGIARQIGLRHD